MARKSREISVVVQEEAFTDRYQVLRAIGHGAFSQVILARHLLTRAEVAVKVLEKRMWKSLARSEKRALMTLNHPNVIQLLQVIDTDQHVYLVMERGGRGSLFDFIPDGGMQEEEEARRLFRQITCAVCYCHKMCIVHGDLKPENIVLDARGDIRLIDFGLSTVVKPGQQQNESWGSLQGPTGDSWKLGIILYFMLTGNRLLRILYPELEFPQHVSAEAQELVKKILAEDPESRLSVGDILEDPWLSQGEENSSSHDEPLPSLSDPTVLTVLFDMGFDPYTTWVSLSKRRFDDAMAAYLLVQQQISQGTGCMKPVRRRVVPQPCPRDPSVSPALPKRRASEPALHTSPLPCEPQPPEEAEESGQKVERSSSVPAIRLRFLHDKTPTPSLASQPDSVCDKPGPCISADSHVSQDATTAHPQGHRKRWKRVRQRIAACLRRLCSCIPSCVSEDEAETQGDQRPAKFGNRVVPI
ncbi:Sperm motility kinase 2B [Sciurus carolinensis]|uniref:non-specific serine/threonine protein kinase n=1 Tax=Sciurus carolinensis TaxID=30640 RepID=A0AA41NHU2_SCICA|nr:Sperm motility kinase 2B [Sciurus carolinensis]